MPATRRDQDPERRRPRRARARAVPAATTRRPRPARRRGAALYTGLYQMNNRVCRNGTPARRPLRQPRARGAPRRLRPDAVRLHRRLARSHRGAIRTIRTCTTYEGVLPGFTTRVKLPEHEKPWLSWLRAHRDWNCTITRARTCRSARTRARVSSRPARLCRRTRRRPRSSPASSSAGSASRTRSPGSRMSPTCGPHPPFIVPAPYNTMFRPEDSPAVPPRRVARRRGGAHPLLGLRARACAQATASCRRRQATCRDFTEAEFRQIKATYYGMIAEVDAQLGRAFDAIKARGEWDDTLVVFTSDHAEMMGDHWLARQGRLLRREPAHPAGHPRSAPDGRARPDGRPLHRVDRHLPDPARLARRRARPPSRRRLAAPVPRRAPSRGPGATPPTGSSTSARSPARPPKPISGCRSTQLNLAVVRTEQVEIRALRRAAAAAVRPRSRSGEPAQPRRRPRLRDRPPRDGANAC